MKSEENFGSISGETNSALIAFACSIGAVFSLVVAILGIKFKWFKHRLNFDGLPTENNRDSTLQESNSSVVLRGVYRSRLEDDVFIETERTKSLPPIRVRKSSKSLVLPVPLHRKINTLPQIPHSPMPAIEPVNENGENNNRANIYADPATLTKGKVVSKEIEIKEKRPKSALKKSKEQKPANPSAVHRIKKKSSNEKTEYSNNDQNPTKKLAVFEKLKTGDDNDIKTHTARRPTGFIRPNLDELETFESNELPVENPKPVKRIHFEKMRAPSSEQFKAVERRPTGFLRPSPEELEALEIVAAVSSQPEDGIDDASQSALKIHDLSHNERESKTYSGEIKHETERLIAFGNDEQSDAWSAVAQRRNLTQELSKYNHESLQSTDPEASISTFGKFRNPLASSDNTRPKTLRDMRKTRESETKNSESLKLPSQDDTDA